MNLIALAVLALCGFMLARSFRTTCGPNQILNSPVDGSASMPRAEATAMGR
jgi:hypothetical protein